MRALVVAFAIACSEAPPPAPPLPDAGRSDGGRPDGGECDRDEDCDDHLFCSGDERCDRGTCTREALDLEDGLLCTTGACNEETDRLDQIADDARCADLDRNPTCGTGTSAGFLLQQIGLCDPSTDCRLDRRPLRDCRSSPSRQHCGEGTILRDDPECIAATSTCGIVTAIERDCADTIPSPHPYCDGSTFHFDARPLCSGDPPACSFTEQIESCTARNPTCTSGFLTTYSAGCDPALGCTETSTTNSCSDPASSCSGNVLTTSAPTCADAMTCGPPTSSMIACTGHNECSGRVFSSYAPTCNPAAEACGETLAAQTDCSFLDDCFCSGFPPNATQQLVTGFCSILSGCDFATSPPVSCPNQCSCSPTPLCN